MNRIYRLVWSRVSNGWVAVAETARGRSKGSGRTLIATSLLLGAAAAQAAPVGGQVASGAGTISQSGSTTTIQQSSPNLSLNWKSFNIGAAETVNFVQPSAAAIAVNRIFDTNGTQILGRINANGQVYLINPNGILFGQGAQVNVGGLVASTLNLNDASLNGNTRSFSGDGTGSIVNQGTINAAKGGYVALLGNKVSNQGVITAQLGTVALGAGSAATLTFSGNSLVRMQVDQSVLNSLAENGGLVRADGGLVVMSAGAKDALLASVVNNTGVIEARTVENHAGTITLLGGTTAGTVNVAGTLDASAARSSISGVAGGEGNGGTIQVLGNRVGVMDGATITASGAQNGGTILIGGDYQGKNPDVPNAQVTYVAPTATLRADGGVLSPGSVPREGSREGNGTGGKVIVWADDTTRAYGTVSAKGGINGGNGGFIETSGKGSIDIAGARVDASAPSGANGHWLLDPSNVTITRGSTGVLATGVFDPATTSSIGDTQINAALNGGTDVTIQTSSGSGGTGSIVVNGSADSGGAAVIGNTSGGTRTLTLTTVGTISIHSGASIAGSAGNALDVSLNAVGGNTIAGTIDNRGGTTALAGETTLSGTIRRGTITSANALNISGALDGVTLGGTTLNTTGNFSILNGITLANGVTVNKGAGEWYFRSTGDQHIATLGTSTLNSSGGRYYAGFDVEGQTLHIDSGVTLGGYGYLSHHHAAPIVNAGTIAATTPGQAFVIDNTDFTNSATGTLSVTAGVLHVGPTTFTNIGTATVSGGTLTIAPGSTWTNPGKINADGGTLNLGGTFTTAELTGAAHYSRTGGSVNVSGTLDNTGTVVDVGSAGLFGAGGLTLLNGTIRNGTVISTDATPTVNISGALDGVTLGGTTLNTNGNFSILNGITLANGVTVNKGAGEWYFRSTGDQHIATLGTSTLNSSGGRYYAGFDVEGQTLHIDSGVTLGGYGYLSHHHAAPIINAGTIAATTPGQAFVIDNTDFTNSVTGTLSVTAGTLHVGPTTFTNIGTATVSGGTLTIAPGSTWTNPGKINADGGTLNLGGTFTTAELTGAAHYSRTGGSVNVSGTLDNTGTVVDVGSAGLFGAGGLTLLNGTIRNGTVISTDATPTVNISGALDGVTLGGTTLNTNGNFSILNGITLANGVTVNKGAGEWYFRSTGDQHIATLGTSTLNSSGGRYYAGFDVEGQTLHIDSGVTLGGYGYLSHHHAAPIVNAGTIAATTPGQAFVINNTAFTNNGTVTATPGSGLNISPNTLTNNGIINGNFTVSVGTFTNNGALTGTGTVNVGGGAGTLVNNGIIAPGLVAADTTGTISITGNLVMGAGSNLNIEINTPLAGDYDVLNVSGTADLAGGTLNLSGIGGAGSFAIVNAAGLGGTSFAAIDSGTFSHTPAYAANKLTLAVTANSNAGIVWDGGAGTANWADALNWSADLVPTAADNLYAGSGAGTVTVTTAGQTANALTSDAHFTLSAGDLNLAGASTFRGTTSISGGTLTGSAAIVIAPGATLNWSGGTIDGTTAAILATQLGSTSNVTGGTLGADRTWNNSGTLNITPATWTKTGTLNQTAGVMNLGGAFATGSLFAFGRTGGSVNITGTLDNTGSVVDVGGGGIFGAGGLTSLNGTLRNGTLVSTDGTPLNVSGSRTLDGVTIGSDLTVNGALYIFNGLTLGNGVTVNKDSTQWYFNGHDTGQAAGTVHHLATLGTSTLNNAGGQITIHAFNGQTLQIDAGVTVQGYGSMGQSWSGSAIGNAGAIVANTEGQSFTINPSTFVNTGTLNATAGVLDVAATAFTNSGTANANAGGGLLNITAATWTNPGKINVNGGTLNLGGTFAPVELTGAAHYSRSGGSVNITGILDNTGSIVDVGGSGIFGAGGLTVLNGTIRNGTLVSTDGTPLNTNGSRLDGVTIGSDLTINGDLHVFNSLRLGDGVTVNKGSSNWYFNGQDSGEAAGTVHHLATFGTSTLKNAGGGIYMFAVNGQTLQIDAGVTVQGYGSLTQYWGGNTIASAGTITANTEGQTFTINPGTFVNTGTLNATAGVLDVAATAFTNSGTANANAGGGLLNITAATWTNPGKINVNSGTLNLGGTFTPVELTGAAHYSRTGGSVNITGILDNTASVVDVGGGGIFGAGGLTALSGTIRNGTLVSTDGTPLNTNGSRLDGVTVGSDLTINGDLHVFNGMTLGNGVTVNKGSSNWYFNGQDSGQAAGTVHHLATLGTSTLDNAGGGIYMFAVNGQTLQIDAGVTLQGYGSLTQYWGGNTIASAGTITANTEGQTFTINPSTFINTGTLNATAGVLDVAATAFTNSGTANANAGGGLLNITAATWTNPGKINVNSGTLNLGGTFTPVELTGAAHYSRTGGSVNITGILDNTGSMVDVGGSGIFGAGGLTALNGTIRNGTLVSSDGTRLNTNGSRLDGVTIGSDLTINGDLHVFNGLTLGDGVTVNKGSSNWYFNGQDSGQAAGTVHHLATFGTSTLSNAGGGIYMFAVNGQTLQIDAGVTVEGYGSLTQYWGGNTIASAGAIIGNTAGQTFTINPETFINTGTLRLTAGTMNVGSAAFTQAGIIDVATGTTFDRSAGFTNTGTLSGAGRLVVGTGAARLVNEGTINPGGTGATGTLSVTGDVQLSTGSTLNMELGGPGAGQFDKLAVSGAVSGIGGSFGDLTLARNNGYTFVNAAGDIFPLLTVASGANSATFAPLAPLARANLSSTHVATSFALTVTPMVLTVSADALSKVYGSVDPTLTYTATGFDAATGDTTSTALSGLLGRAAGPNVGDYAINQGALTSPLGYAISITPGRNLSITPASLTVTANSATRTYDGTLTAPTTAAVSSGTLFGSDALSGGTFAYTDKNVGSGNKTVTATGVTVGQGGNYGNYNVSYVDNTTSTINPYVVSLGGSRAYDGTVNVAAGAVTLGTLVGSETLALSGSGTVANKNAGPTKALTLGTLAIGSGTGLASNYTLTGGTHAVDITAATLSVTANAVTKTYDGSLTAGGTGTVGALAGAGDSVLGAGSQAFLDKNAGDANKVVRASGVSIQDAGNVDVSGNYTITYVDNAAGTINKALLSATVSAVNKTYDGTFTAAPTLSISAGLVGSETVTAVGTASFNTKDVLTANLVTVNTTALANGSNGGLASNYSLTTGQSVAANITPQALTGTVAALNKVYDGNTTAAPTLSIIAGLVGSETVTAAGTASFNTKDVLTANLVTVNTTALANGSNGGLASNYSLTTGQSVAANITPQALTGTVAALNKVYDGNTTAAPTLSIIAGLVGSETVTAAGTASFNTKDVLTANLVTVNTTALANGSNGGLASNYSLTTGQSVAANITPQALTGTVAALNKVYDGNTTAAPTLSIIAGLVGSETVTATGTASFNSKDVLTANQVTVNSTALTDGSNGGLASNYSLATGQSVTASITPRALTGTVAALNKVYDGNTTAAPTLSITAGLVGSETVTATGIASFNTKDVLTANLVTVSSAALANGSGGGLASNYTLTTGQSVAANITPRALTATVAAPNKVYDGHTTAAPTLSIIAGLVGSETVTATGTASFNTKDVLTANLVTVSSAALANGSSGGIASNYSLATGQSVTANITPRALTSTVAALNKVYDGNTTAAATLSITAGLVGSETVTATGTGSFNTKDVLTANLVTVSSAALANDSGGGLASNYSLATGQSVAANITPRALTASVAAPNKVYDGNTTATPTLSIIAGLVGSETVTATGTASFNAKDVLTANLVTVSSAALANGSNGGLASNYSLAGGQSIVANITPQALTGIVVAPNKVYDGNTTATPTLSIIAGLVGSETVTATGTASFNTKDVLTANQVTVDSTALTNGSNGGLASNYSLTTGQSVAANITPQALTSTVAAVNKVYDGNTTATPTLSIIAGLVGSETVTATGTASFNTKDVLTANLVTVNSAALANGSNGGLASNYSLTTGQSSAANITPRALTASVAAPNKVYDGNTTAAPTLSITTGLVGSETVTATGTASFNTKDVLTANLVTVSSAALANGSNGGLAGNYSLAAGQSIAANITPHALTGTVVAPNKVYDGNTTAAPTLSIIAGLVGSETVTATGTASFNTKDVLTANQVSVDSTALTNGSNGGLASNYSLATGQSVAANITPRALTASVATPNKVYDGNTTAAPTLSIIAGLVGSETVTATGTASFNTKDVLTANLVTVSSAALANDSGGGLASNYSLATGQSVAANITPRALTATVAAPNKVYDGNTTATPTLSIIAGLVGSETVTAAGTASFNTKDVLTANQVTVDSTALTNGSNGGIASNYSLATGQTFAANITARALTVSGTTASNKEYDGGTRATVNTAAAEFNGLVAGDVVNVSTTGVFADGDVGVAKMVTLTSNYTGADVGNYSISGQTSATADITPAALTPAMPLERAVSAAAHIQSSVNWFTVSAEPAALKLFPTATVTQISSPGTAADADASPRSGTGAAVNTTMNIGTTGLVLQIVNGGIKLPAEMASVQSKDQSSDVMAIRLEP